MDRWIIAVSFAAILASNLPAELVHRYSFNGNCNDSVGTSHGTLVNGTGQARFANGQLTLGNNGSQTSTGSAIDYVDLPNGIISSLGKQATFEAWVTWTGSSMWQRIFDFGTSSAGEGYSASSSNTTYFFASPLGGASVVRFGYRYGPAADERVMDGPVFGSGQRHIAITWNEDTAETVMYLDGVRVASGLVHFTLASMTDNNNWLGRSQWVDPMFCGSYNEFRIWNHAMTDEEVLVSFNRGPDSIPLLLLDIQQTDGATSVQEGKASDSISITLKKQPTANVQVTLTPQTEDVELNGGFPGDPITLTFTPANWAVAQTVQLVAVQDDLEEGDEVCSVAFGIVSADPDYNNGYVSPLSVFIVDYVVHPCPAGDINGDCEVTLDDLQWFAMQWLDPAGCSGLYCGDLIGGDGVNFADLVILSESWLDTFGPVVINEFMAQNASTNPDDSRESWEVFDETGESTDWIELYNVSNIPISMNGWYLTDNPDNLTQWAFPSHVILQPKSYLLIYASGKGIVSGNYIHTNFSLSEAGEYLALVAPGGKIVSEYRDVNGGYPPQETNISYGLFGYFTEHRYFYPATPNRPNKNSAMGIAPDTKFSVKRGFFTAPFDVAITTDDPTATIRYTLDGSTPTLENGFVYNPDTPIRISKTTTLRATAFKTGWLPGNVDTQTYIFIGDVITQSPNGELPGPGWPASRAVNSHIMDYGMDPDIINHAVYSSLMDEALLAIPTLSLVTDLKYLFDPVQGVYVNTGETTRSDGDSFERPCSLELINPDGSDGFQIDCGMRIRGGASRNANNPKHALRFFFRSQYGAGKLKYPLFGEEGTDEFDKMDLRTAANYGWSACWLSASINVQNTFVRDEYSRLVQGLLGHPYTRGRYYHLYINGQYWGLYQTEERPDARFAASYLGGVKDDYDVVKPDITVGRTVAATDGNMDAYRRLYDAVIDGIGSITEYYALQGMNPDGTRNPAYERLLDVDNLIDYMLIDYYSSDGDGAGSRFVATNNFFGIYNRNNPDGFKWIQHDSEHTFGAYEAGDSRRENMVTPLTTAGANFAYFNPHWLHEQLANQNLEYRLRFADRTQELFFNGGLLSADRVWQTMTGLASQIDMAIIAESARWGDATVSTPRTRQTWLEALTFLHNYIYGTSSTLSDPTANGYQNWPMQLREIRVRDQFRSVKWFPAIDAPQFGQQGGYVASNYALSISNPNSSGTIYYTLDGSDPRQAPTDEQAGTEVVLIAENATKQVLIPTQNIYAPDGTVRAETWTGITGDTVASLTGNANYPNNPTKVEFWNSFQMPTINWADYYGTRVRALVYPPTTGSYTFWIASDDNGQLLVSTDATAANASVAASISSWVNPNTWTTYSSQKSTSRVLTAGNAYYIEAIQKEHAGGDHLSIAWSGPGISGPVVIAGQYLSIPENVWASRTFTPTGWMTGSGAVGYERNPGDAVNFSSYVNSGINVGSQMYNVNTSCYIRIPFQYDGQAITELLLKIRYDDGIIVFLNGKEVVRDNVAAGAVPAWNTAAVTYRDDSIALTQTVFDLSSYINQLQVGTNILAIQGMNNVSTSSDFLVSAQLVGRMSIGTPSTTAMIYTSPVTLSKSTQVKARVFTGSEWSTVNKATFAVGPVKESLRVTELMYNPQDPNLEFIELQNVGTEAINLNWVTFDRGITHTFDDVDVAPNGFVLLVNNKPRFESAYTIPAGVPVIQWTSGQLSNSGETIQLRDAAGAVVQSFAYKDSWYPQTDGDGFSLTMLNPTSADLTLWSQKTGWAPSTYTGGSPGRTDAPLAPGSIVINEILAHSHDNAPDWIELYNTTDSPISVGGWYLSDDAAVPQKYQIPDGLFVPRYGYLVLYEDTHFGTAFRLSENGEEVCLTAAVGGVVTGYSVKQEFGASETGVSFGRYQKTSGGYDFVLMTSNTPNAANAAPLVGPVVITEIMYNPLSNGDAEYVEIQNISSQTVDLWLSDAGQVIPWRFVDEDSSILLNFPADTWLAPGEKMLLIKNLTAFQSEFGSIPSGLKYAVWSSGSLSNGGERLELLKPGDTADGVRYYIRVDRVNYDDDAPWPTSPDGTGKALGRITPSAYGNDYANWQAITPTPGQ